MPLSDSPSSLFYFEIQAKAHQLADQHVEGFRNVRLRKIVSLDDAFVQLGSPVDVVALDRQDFLEDVGRAVRFKRPDLHLSEPLAAELGLSAERLLRDEGVGTDGTRMDLVVDEVRELHHVDKADGHVLVELL